MEMCLITPTKLFLPDDNDHVKRFLTFRDRSVDFQVKKMSMNYRWKNSDPDGFTERLEELKAQSNKCLLFYDEDGKPYTYSGLWQDLNNQFGWNLSNNLKLEDDAKTLPWLRIPHEMRYYQKDAVEALINARHGGVELPTGSGKSLIILNLSKRLPYKTIVITPSSAITDQLYNEYVYYFGIKYVGKYGDGSKQFNKLFTIATAQSLTRLAPGSDAYEELSKAKVIVWDESHTTAAETFEKVCTGTGVASNAFYRFFTSATQMRVDGSEMILRGITGPIVYRKDFKTLVNEGFLSKMVFKTFKVPAFGPSNSSDAKTETRNQLYSNQNVNKLAADIATKSVLLANRPTIIIIEEFKQFLLLKNYLGVTYEFVHGGASKDAKESLPKEYWKSDTEQAIKNFNEGRTKLLIGTSAISTGVDLKPTQCIVYLQGGTSEIKVRQSIGRGTRLVGDKKDCWVVDFKVMGSKTMERHYGLRKQIYESIDTVEEYG